MIHEEICTYDVCKLAKEKGFPQDTSRWLRNAPCRNYYTRKGELNGDCMEIVQYMIANKTKDIPDNLQTVAAPTQSILQQWLRKQKRIEVNAFWDNGCDAWFGYAQEMDAPDLVGSFPIDGTFSTYELALEAALKFTLENLVD